jgi:hypothetical protein
VLITGIDAEERGEVSSEGESEELEMGGGSREREGKHDGVDPSGVPRDIPKAWAICLRQSLIGTSPFILISTSAICLGPTHHHLPHQLARSQGP